MPRGFIVSTKNYFFFASLASSSEPATATAMGNGETDECETQMEERVESKSATKFSNKPGSVTGLPPSHVFTNVMANFGPNFAACPQQQFLSEPHDQTGDKANGGRERAEPHCK